jgi:adenylosuccinate synthase
MIKADIVIGANLGDEGKGLITDFYASQSGPKALVVRHNSGPQAGHTVTLADGRRHVFGHIGAGSFTGAQTYLSRHYACNPLLFRKEYLALQKISFIPTIYVDSRAVLTTPYDMMINQMIEQRRCRNRHGSCGVGYGETIERNLYREFSLRVKDIEDIEKFAQRLVTIRNEWLPRRLLALGIDKVPAEWAERIESTELLADYIDAAGFFMRTTKRCKGLPATQQAHVIFEGAQGLLLDQDHEWFPHVTRSSTGIINALDILDEAGIDEADVTYVTRSYLTRHGAGPMPSQTDGKPYPGIVDETNGTNAFQGSFRLGLLEIDRLAEAIRKDLALAPAHMKLSAGLAVTCMDQIEGEACYMEKGKVERSGKSAFLQKLMRETGALFGYASYGPTRQTIQPVAAPQTCITQGEYNERYYESCVVCR